MTPLPVFAHAAAAAGYRPPHHHGTFNRALLGPANGVHPVQVLHGTLQPGGAAHPHLHHHSDQVVYVLAGRCRATAGEHSSELSVGDCAFLPARLAHRVDVLGDTDLHLLVVYTPPLDPDDIHPTDDLETA